MLLSLIENHWAFVEEVHSNVNTSLPAPQEDPILGLDTKIYQFFLSIQTLKSFP